MLAPVVTTGNTAVVVAAEAYPLPAISFAEVLATWIDAFDMLYKWGSAMNLGMHPQIIGRPSRFAVLERLINHMQSKPGVRFSRIDHAAAEWAAANAGTPAVTIGAGAPAAG